MDTGNVCRIADFGLARDIYEKKLYLKKGEVGLLKCLRRSKGSIVNTGRFCLSYGHFCLDYCGGRSFVFICKGYVLKTAGDLLGCRRVLG